MVKISNAINLKYLWEIVVNFLPIREFDASFSLIYELQKKKHEIIKKYKFFKKIKNKNYSD